MKSIERRFNQISKENPNWSSLICFSEAVREGGFSSNMIRRWFYKLVSKDDYQQCDKKLIIQHIDTISKRAEDDKK